MSENLTIDPELARSELQKSIDLLVEELDDQNLSDEDREKLNTTLEAAYREKDGVESPVVEDEWKSDSTQANHLLEAGENHFLEAEGFDVKSDGGPVLANEVSGKEKSSEPNVEFLEAIGWNDERRPDEVAAQHEFDEFMNGSKK